MIRKITGFAVCVLMTIMIFSGCGTNTNNSLPNEYKGDFFSVRYPADFETLPKDSGVTITKDEQAIMIDAIENADSKIGNISSIEGFIQEITESASNLDIETVEVNDSVGIWIEGENDGKNGIMLVIPFDGWFAVAINNGTLDEKILSLHRSVIESIIITDTAYIKNTPIEIPSDNIGTNDETNLLDDTESTTDESMDETDSTTDSVETDSDTTKIDVSKLSAEGIGLQLGEYYQGNYFKMRLPNNADVADFSQGDSQMVSIMIEDFQIIVSAIKEQQELNTETSSGEIDLESGTMRFSNSVVEIDGHLANFVEMISDESISVAFAIPLDGWTINISGYEDGTKEHIELMYETIKSMVETFEITDINYLN